MYFTSQRQKYSLNKICIGYEVAEKRIMGTNGEML